MQENRSTEDLLRYATYSAVSHGFLSKGKLQVKSETDSTVLAELLLHFLQSASINSQVLETQWQNIFFGKGYYPFASLLNHSCSPNVIRVAYKKQLAVVALRFIKPGEQLLDSYR